MSDIRVQHMRDPVDVTEYLLRRLYEIGVRSIHGVPGDYNLVALDYIPKCNIKWVGSVNELNAAYAADGYARVNGIGAVFTTFGVGELSALNGLAGAFSERVPIVHIVGCPSTRSQREGMLLHHTLGNGNFNVFADMSAMISCNVARLNTVEEIAVQIDHALRECIVQARPVYIMLPTDMATAKIEGHRLKIPIDLSYPDNNPDQEAYLVDIILRYLYAAKRPVVLLDACAIRHRVLAEVKTLLSKINLPVFVTPMGKSAVSEYHPNYGGVYAGDGSRPPHVKNLVESSDLILSVGGLKSDFNTAGFSYHTSQLKTIEFHSDNCVVRYSSYPGARMKGVLRSLVAKLDPKQISKTDVPAVMNEVEKNTDASPVIRHAWFWPRVGEFFEENDIIVTETGTANFGIWDTKFPAGATALSQVLWGSIGWSVGALQGACLAARDMGVKRRTILFVGDGSFQLTAQELSTVIRHRLKPIIFLINNDGYTIERFIHGMDAEYNNINGWDYKALVDVMGGWNSSKKYVVKTKDELDRLLLDSVFTAADCLQFVEVFMPRDDAPPALMTADATAKTNAHQD